MVSAQEIQYLTSQCLARIVIVSTQLQPEVAPVGFEFDGQYFYQWFSQKSGGDSAVSSEFVIAGMIFHYSRVKSELLHK